MSVSVSWGSHAASTAETGALRISELTFPAQSTLGQHEHERPTLAVVVAGFFEATLDGRSAPCDRITLRLEPAEARHANRFGPQGARVVVVQPDPTAVALAPATAALARMVHLRDPRVAILARLISTELRGVDRLSAIALEGLGLELVATAARLGSRASLRTAPWLSAATDLLHEHFREPLQIDGIAAAVGAPPLRLVRAFRLQHGVPIGAYLRRLRLEWAARRLCESAEPISAIALEAGFADQPHLTRLFRAAFGLTPRRYRELSRH